MIKRPMLAARDVFDPKDIKYPKLLSPKIDGIRCVIISDEVYSRNLKPIPNKHVKEMLKRYAANGLDGELYVPGKTFNQIQSLIMSEDGVFDFEFIVFDKIHFHLGYQHRIEYLESNKYVKVIQNIEVNSAKEVLYYKEKFMEEGYEGVMLRDPNGPYKEGRSTLKEEYLLKVKEWQDAEATIVDFVEMQSNTNAAKKNKLGYTERSKKKAGLKPKNMLGKLIVQDVATKKQFEIGSGFTVAQRKEIWNSKDTYLGKTVTYKWQKEGAKDLPRFPIFKGFRKEYDG